MHATLHLHEDLESHYCEITLFWESGGGKGEMNILLNSVFVSSPNNSKVADPGSASWGTFQCMQFLPFVTGYEKRDQFSFYISGTIAAMNFKPGINTLFFHHPATLTMNSEPRPLLV